MTSSSVLALIDAAPPFAEAPPLSAEQLRRAGLAELEQQLALIRAAAGDDRKPVLTRAAEQLGHIIATGALNEAFAKAAIEEAASVCGLIRDDGARAVRKAISDAVKLGKKAPRDLRRTGAAFGAEASAAGDAQRRGRDAGTGAEQLQSRPRDAADRMSSPHAEAAELAPSSHVASSSPAPAPPAAGADELLSSQMGVAPDAVAIGGAGETSAAADDDHAAPPPEDASALNLRLAFHPLTDLGNAERFRDRYRGRLRWNAALGWLVWDGKRWSRDGAEDLVMIAEHDTVRAIQDEAEAVRDSGNRDGDDPPFGARDFVVEEKRDGTRVLFSDKVSRWGRSSEAVNKLGALSKRGAPYFAVGIDRLDADKMKINVNNGTLVVRRRDDGDYVEFKPHDPADLITKLAPVDYDPAAGCPVFDAFLAKVQPQAEMRLFLMQWLGLSLTGDVSEQKLAFLYGKGSNGKSVLIDAVSYVAGDYGETVPIETFLDHGKSRGAGQATPDLAILPGVRMLRTSEPEKNSKLAEAMVKLVTGGEPIQARHLNRDFFKFYPQFKLTISGNYRPSISGSDEGIWRRLKLVPFSVFIPKEERDIRLGDKLRLEASGILNRLLDGLRSWCDNGLSEPEAVATATADYRSASDPLGRFLATCIVVSDGDRVQSSVLHEVYEAWCKSSGEKAWSNRGLSLAMDERGFKRKQSNTVFWLDIKLTKSANDFIDHQGNAIRMQDSAMPATEAKDAGDVEF